MQPEVIQPNPTNPGDAAIPPVRTDYAMINEETPHMENQNTNISGQGYESGPPPAAPPLGSVFDRAKIYISGHRLQIIIIALLALLVGNMAVSALLFRRVNNYSALSAIGLKKTAVSSSTFNGDNTLYINTKNKGVGVGAAAPEGLQVESGITSTARGSANVRAGLLNGEPTVLLEDQNALQWELGISNTSLQLGQPGTAYVQLDKNGFTSLGNTTIGSSAGNTLTIQASSLSAPNNLNIGNNALFIDTAHGNIAIGASSASGFKLLVAGNLKANGSIQSGGQFIGVAGSAAQPAITFASSNSGIFSPGGSTTSVSTGGTETLRVQSGAVLTLNDANLDVSGFLQAGSNNPSWKITRYTGTLDGLGTGIMAHGISNASARVIMAMAWYQSGGSAKALSVDYIDGTNMQVSGGVPGSAWRGAIVYTVDAAGW